MHSHTAYMLPYSATPVNARRRLSPNPDRLNAFSAQWERENVCEMQLCTLWVHSCQEPPGSRGAPRHKGLSIILCTRTILSLYISLSIIISLCISIIIIISLNCLGLLECAWVCLTLLGCACRGGERGLAGRHEKAMRAADLPMARRTTRMTVCFLMKALSS